MNPWNFENRYGGGDWADLSRLNRDWGPWRRRPRRGVLAGVCAGLAGALRVDPLLVRLGFVAAGLFSGPLAVLGYVVLAAVLPVDDDYQPAAGAAPQPQPQTAAAAEEPAAGQLAALRDRLRACDRRVAELERRVVTESASLHRAFHDLGKQADRP